MRAFTPESAVAAVSPSGATLPPANTPGIRITYQGVLLNPTGLRVVGVDPEEQVQQRRQELREAKERQEALLRQTPPDSGFSWLLERQIMFHGGSIYVHDGPTDTLPSHDLAHLLVGMCGNLPWCPTGSDAEVRISEFNAALLENLLSYTYEHVACRSIDLDAVLPKTLEYARWFVEKHYAPFPMPLEEAYRRFCLGIDVEATTNLAHYFFTQKQREREAKRRDGPWEMLLLRAPPAGLGAPVQQFQALIGGTLYFMRARQFGPDGAAAFGRPTTVAQPDNESTARTESSIGVATQRMRDPEQEDPQRNQELREAKERQAVLLRRTPAGSGFSWLHDRQIMFHRRRIYVHDGPTDTLPSHDLAHLLVGMGSNLPWCPTGPDAEVRVSEFNAAVLENLLSYMYEHVAHRSIGLDEVLPKTLQYAGWFVEKHYAPFPMPLEEAYRRFCLGIDVEAITNLAHYFFTQKEREHQGERRDGPWEMRLIRQPPATLGASAQQFQSLIRSALLSMRARQLDPGVGGPLWPGRT
jgi:hypothetical protein